MQIILAKKQDALEIARLHKLEISQGFLSSLPLKFLEKIYLCIIENDFCVVALEDNRVIGFLAGTANIKKMYKFFIKKYFWASLILLLPKILDIRRIFEALLYPSNNNSLPEAELLTIAVAKEFQSQGVGKKMLELFLLEAKKRHIKEFKVLVGEGLDQAIKFYEKNGFKFLRETIVHNNKKSKIYVYSI